MSLDLTHIRNFIIDMDGVIWHGDVPMPRLVEFFDTLRQRNIQFVLATNNASRSAAQFIEKLSRMGVRVLPNEILNSAQATATYIAAREPDARIYVVGEVGLMDELRAQKLSVVNGADWHSATHVVCGLDQTLSYHKLADACLLIRRGAKFIGTNPDVTLPSDRGIVPGNGAILALLRACTDVEPLIIGKPQPEMMLQAMQRMHSTPRDTAVIGDRLDTDILGGINAGLPSILVLSGVTSREQAQRDPIRADAIYDDIAAITDALKSL
jgi:4-nitrophenyl phosphatase